MRKPGNEAKVKQQSAVYLHPPHSPNIHAHVPHLSLSSQAVQQAPSSRAQLFPPALGWTWQPAASQSDSGLCLEGHSMHQTQFTQITFVLLIHSRLDISATSFHPIVGQRDLLVNRTLKITRI